MKPDLSTWYTEPESAEAIGCSVRTLQRYAEQGKLEIRKRQRDGKKPENVCNPHDVDRLRPAAFVAADEPENEIEVVRAAVQKGRNGHGQANADAFFAFISTITTAIATRAEIVAPPPRPWLTPEEAGEITGLTPAFIRDRARVGLIAHCYGGAHGALLVNRASLLEFRG